ncbi:MAG: Hsp20/alpha crystallin family protein [Candidatus Zixiibacteriota bacterium]|nr:MAG: Hsp20/alpha crystallin family protein [candidate division Zixibacteria bacterium]
MAPRMDVRDTNDNLFLTFELPGVKKDDIKVNIRENVLTVTAKRETKEEVKDDEFIRREIRSGSFCRSVTLPDTVNTDKISADYKNGLLEIKLEKLEEVKPKEIEVKVS